MFNFLKFLVWTTCAMGLGLWLSTVSIDGKTPVEHIQKAWKKHGSGANLAGVKGLIDDALSDAKDLSAGKPQEKHTEAEKDAVNKIIAKHQKD